MTLNHSHSSPQRHRNSGRGSSKIKRSRQYRERAQRLNLSLERLEDRALMALGPTLIAINPNTGAVLANGDTRNVAPTDLTFRFDNGQAIDVNTLAAGITIVASGGAGDPFGAGGSKPDKILQGYVNITDKTTPNEVVFRFFDALTDDDYRIFVTPQLKNENGDAFDANRAVAGNQSFQMQFRLDLGPKVVAVVPQPVVRQANGTIAQSRSGVTTRNQIEVYFNNDALDPIKATNPAFYQLTFTKDTARNTDDVVFNPTGVNYNPARNLVTLTFANGGATDLANLDIDPGTAGVQPAIGTFRLRVGTSETVPVAPVSTTVPVANDPGSSFTTARDLTATPLDAGGQIFSSAIDPQFFPLDLPGGPDMPGERDINSQDHLLASADTTLGVRTEFYNFRDDYGFDTFGNALTNAITPAQKDLARQIFELLGTYWGIKFVESATNGLTVATGDMRTIDTGAVTGKTGQPGLFGFDRINGNPEVVINNAFEPIVGQAWNEDFGGSWFQEAMREISHFYGLGYSPDLPPITVQGTVLFPGTSSNATPNATGIPGIQPGDPTIQVGSNAQQEPVFPGDGDNVHGQYLYRPESKDIDLYKFKLNSEGTFTAETFAERQANSSLLNSALRIYQENPDGTRTLLAQNDDYYGKDAFVQLTLAAGTYYVGVSASGNTSYDPTILDSGFGGTSQGNYDLRLDFRTKASNFITDTTGTPFDGDADGVPGGAYNFWFRSQTQANTVFVDKVSLGGAGIIGSITNPYREIDQALLDAKVVAGAQAGATPGQGAIVRVIGNGVVEGNKTAVPYEIGKNSQFQPLVDGVTLAVPKNTTMMIDAGAAFKLLGSHIAVGSSSSVVDRSGSALQILGTPELSVYFTSNNDASVALDTNPDPTPASGGDWGGILFQSNLDKSANRFLFEDRGIFMNYVNHADMRYGGGTIDVEGNPRTVTPVDMVNARPTITFNKVTRSANAAVSANPDSFEETNFHAATFQAAGAYTPDYARVGPEVHDNLITDNSLNGMLVRVTTFSNAPPERMTVSGRFDDVDIVHVISENLLINGTPGGPIQEGSRPPVTLVQLVAQSGGTIPSGTSRYRITFVDAAGNEGPASLSTAAVTLAGANHTVRLTQLPTTTLPFVARRIYRSDNGGAFDLVKQIDPSSTVFVDNGTMAHGALGAATTPFRARLDGRLAIDAGIIVKTSRQARIEAMMGATLIAEGVEGRKVVFTSVNDDRYGAGGTFDTKNDGQTTPAAAGDWGGLVASPTSTLSMDNAVVAFGGGVSRLQGTFAGFNPLEIYQATARVTNSTFEFNGNGVGGQAPLARFGYGFNDAAAIFVRGAQPIIVNNQFRHNNKTAINGPATFNAAISINANALNSTFLFDTGRSTGLANPFTTLGDNQGPLIRLNRLDDNKTNGMLVRGQTLTTQGVWDDADIVHVLTSEVKVPDFHVYGGLRLQSSPTGSLVIKLLGASAGFTATGRPLEITDRIGGSLQVIGQPGFPVVMTSLADDTVGAGFTQDGSPQTDTNGDGIFDPNANGQFLPGPITVAPTTNANLLRDTLLGPGITPVGNATLIGSAVSAGLFSGGSDSIGLASGILLTTGDATFAAGPNTSDSSTGTASGAGDAQLDATFGVSTQDTTSLQFDFTTTGGDLFFSFVFASEEYNEFANSSFNDVFAFYIDGQNIALVPNTTIPISINTINGGDPLGTGAVNPQFYVNNDIDDNGGFLTLCGYDGFTTVLTATKLGLGPGVHTIRLALSDTTDSSLDTGVFLRAGSFSDTLPVARPAPGDWRGLLIDNFSHDRNVEIVTENESPTVAAPGVNATINSAQFMGNLAPNEKSGDDVLRLGFEAHGLLASPSDIDVYSFKAATGTEVWFDLDRTTMALDAVLELIDANGSVLAASDSSMDERNNPALRSTLIPDPDNPGQFLPNLALDMQKAPPFEGTDFYSINPRDPGMRVVLPGSPNQTNTYHIRVTSKNSLTFGEYQLQVRLREVDEVPGTTVRQSDIRYATNGIDLRGQVTHSPLVGESAEIVSSANGTAPTTALNSAPQRGNSQDMGNLFASDRGTLTTTGTLSSFTDVDFYSFRIDPLLAPPSDFGAIFDVDYADGLGRPDTSLAVFQEVRTLDANNNVILVYPMIYLSDNSRNRPNSAGSSLNSNSNVAEDRVGQLQSADLADLSRGSAGGLDAYIGPANLRSNFAGATGNGLGRTGLYFVAVTSDAGHPTELTINPATGLPFNVNMRLEPIESVQRIADDNIDASPGGAPITGPVVPILFNAPSANNPADGQVYGFALVAPRGDQLVDGETFTITDTAGTAVTFEFDNNGAVGTGNRTVTFASGDSAATIAGRIATSINGSALSAALKATMQQVGPRVNFTESVFAPTKVSAISQRPAPGQTATAMFISRPSIVPFNLGDVSLFVSRNANSLNTTQLYTVDPYSGQFESVVGNVGVDFADIAMRMDQGRLYAFTTNLDPGFGPNDAGAGNFIEINPATAAINNIGDDGIDTFQLDVANAPNAVASNVGIQFSATAFGDLNNGGLRLYSVGDRGDASAFGSPPAAPGVDYDKNILYQFNTDTGAAFSSPATTDRPGPNNNPFEYVGAGTDIVERGYLDTKIDDVPGGVAGLVAVEATQVQGANTISTINEALNASPLPEGVYITVTVGGTTTIFEMDSGPDVRTDINPAVPSTGKFVRDGQFFDIDNNFFQFDTGPVINLTAPTNPANSFFNDTSVFTLTDTGGISKTFEFDLGGNGAAGTNVPIAYNVGDSLTQIASDIITAINGATFGVTALAKMDLVVGANNPNTRISLTGDTNFVVNPGAVGSAFNVVGGYGGAPLVQCPAPATLLNTTFDYTVNGVTTTVTFVNGGAGPNQIDLSGAATPTDVAIAIEALIPTIATQVGDKVIFNGLGVAFSKGVGSTLTVLPTVPIAAEENNNTAAIGTAVANTVTTAGLGFSASSEGNRINFPGAIDGDFEGMTVGGTGGAPILFIPRLLADGVTQVAGGAQLSGAIPVPFGAADSANAVANAIALAVNTQLAGTVQASVSGANVTFTAVGGNPNPVVITDPPFTTGAVVPGTGTGKITGMAFVDTDTGPNTNSDMYVVDNKGHLFHVLLNGNEQALFGAQAAPLGGRIRMDFIETGTALAGKVFAGLTTGPQNVEGGRYANLLFGITTTGELICFNTLGVPQPVFLNGATSVQIAMPSGGNTINGVAFSNLDVNLWHVSNVTPGNAGVGDSGSNLYFGYESPRANVGRTQVPTLDPSNASNYNFPGGAYGSVVSNAFSLEGYSPADQPVLYFDYFADTGANDSFRVFIANDQVRDTTGAPVTTDNPNDWIQIGATMANTSNNWRQVRIPLDSFAGQKGLRLRFDFSTASDMQVGDTSSWERDTVGSELRGVDASLITDGQTFTIDSQVFEFDSGITLNAVPGAHIADHTTFTITRAGGSKTFEFVLGTAAVNTAGAVRIQLTPTQTAAEVAELMRQAIAAPATGLVGLVTPFLNDTRINLRGATNGTTVPGGTSITRTGSTGVTGANLPVVIHGGMGAGEVATAVWTALNNRFMANGQTFKLFGDYIHIIGHTITNRGPLGANTTMPGDQVNTPTANPLTNFNNFGTNVGFNNPSRGDDNNFPGVVLHQGVHLDHIMVGFAERGERVVSSTGANGAGTFTFPLVEPSGQILEGDYQLEIRRAGEPAASIDTNDRMASKVTLVATAGMNLVDGQVFTVSDGINTVTFEYDDVTNPLTGGIVVQGNIPVSFSPTDTKFQVATTIRDVVNGPDVQNVIPGVVAVISDGAISGDNTFTGNLVNLFGAAEVRSQEVYIGEFNDTAALAYNTGIDTRPTAQKNIDDPNQTYAPFYARGFIGDNEHLALDSNKGKDVDLISMVLRAGERVQIDVDAAQLGSTLDSVLRIFNALGQPIDATGAVVAAAAGIQSDDNPARDERFSLDSYLDFIAPFDGTFLVGISGFANGVNPTYYNATTEGSGTNGSTGYYSINIRFGAPGNTNLEYKQFDQYGDQNEFRDQGQLIIQQNRIFDSLNFGIVSDSGTPSPPAVAGGAGITHAGSVLLLSKANTDRWAPAATIVNNLIVRGGQGGIHFSGENSATDPDGIVPFGRIINNTIVGSKASDIGILVDDNASPTLLNNIVSHLGTGIRVADVGSNTTVVGGTIYHDIAAGSQLTGPGAPANGGDDALTVAAGAPMFINAAKDNYYLAAGSLAVDSGIDSLEDRNHLKQVREPLDIAFSSILAPDRDLTGQKRVDVPNVGDTGGGTNPFKDRGALDRADFIGPSAILIDPQDNDVNGIDQEPATTIVRLDDTAILTNFVIQLVDGFNPTNPLEGTGIDNFTVSADKVEVTKNGVEQTLGVDYTLAYDTTNHLLRVVPLTGIWLPGSYVVTLDNSPNRFLISPITGAQILDGQTFTVTDNASPVKKTVIFEFDNGVNFAVPAQGGGVGGITDGQRFTVANGGTPVTFEFNDGTGPALGAGIVPVPFTSGAAASSQNTIANNIVTAITGVAALGLTGANAPVNVGGGRVVFGTNAAGTLPTVVTGPGGGTPTFTITGKAGLNAIGSTNIRIPVGANLTATEMANLIASAITGNSTLSGITVKVLATNEVLIRNVTAFSSTVLQSVKGGIRDLAGNDLKPNQLDGTTKFTIILGNPLDYGDAPDTFRTLLANDGARHRIVTNYSLGPTISADADGQPGPQANSDIGDDGVTLLGGVIQGGGLSTGTATFRVNLNTGVGTPTNGILNAWIDFNQDGVFQASEQISSFTIGGVTTNSINIPLAAGDTTFTITVPSEVPPGAGATPLTKAGTHAIARFRLSSVGNLNVNGQTSDGEVEDYNFTVITGLPFRNERNLVLKGRSVGHLDVNNDGAVDSRDAFTIISAFRLPAIQNNLVSGRFQLPVPSLPGAFPNNPNPVAPNPAYFFVDTAGSPGVNFGFSDNFFDTFDIAAVIAQIKINPFGEAEATDFSSGGEGEARYGSSVSDSFASTTYASAPVDVTPAAMSKSSAVAAAPALTPVSASPALALSPPIETKTTVGSAGLTPDLGVEIASGAVPQLSALIPAPVRAPSNDGLESTLAEIAGVVGDKWDPQDAIDALFGEHDEMVPEFLTARATPRMPLARAR